MGCTFINEPLQEVILLLNDEKIAPAKIQNLDFFSDFSKIFQRIFFWEIQNFLGSKQVLGSKLRPPGWSRAEILM